MQQNSLQRVFYISTAGSLVALIALCVAWELLLAMLVMEAAFGISGLIAAPIYYAYLKDELVSRKLI